MTEREHHAKQLAQVVRQFKEYGEVDAHHLLIVGSITRTAHYIWYLRSIWGKDSIITRRGGPGNMATYVLARLPETFAMPPRKPRANRRGTWTCTTCGQTAMSEGLVKRTPTVAVGQCGGCGASRMFRAAS